MMACNGGFEQRERQDIGVKVKMWSARQRKQCQWQQQQHQHPLPWQESPPGGITKRAANLNSSSNSKAYVNTNTRKDKSTGTDTTANMALTALPAKPASAASPDPVAGHLPGASARVHFETCTKIEAEAPQYNPAQRQRELRVGGG